MLNVNFHITKNEFYEYRSLKKLLVEMIYESKNVKLIYTFNIKNAKSTQLVSKNILFSLSHDILANNHSH